ncbi:hypothetical protein TIFTF001_033985 [Ficus carica]|uniref:Uncharacterized protein n=1 Tax=Ficus carica TaxID=3494 RepID=A0AA88JA36_FICCA|nr:hypothetical protein TIFTF001_033985 [Ficus carica]
MHHYQLAIPQLMPNGMRVFLGLIVLVDEAGVELSVDDILAIYYPLAKAFYPLRGLLRKELKKPPPKALLFKEKLEQLLALPNREWDEINVPKRLRASSLWKDFVELKTSIIKRIPSWVDWPFMIRGALRRLFGTPLPSCEDEGTKEAAKAVAAKKTARGNEPPPLPVIESSPEPLVMHVQSPAKKRKAGKKPKRKVSAKRKKASKASTSETDAELRKSKQDDQSIEVNLPPGTSLLQNRNLSVEVVRQLLSVVDLDTINDGRIHNHLDDLLWDGLKSNLRALRLIYRTTDKVVEQKKLIKELEDKDKDHGEKLLNIERKFKNVKASANDLIAELQKYKQGLLIDAGVEEEIELYEDSPAEAGESSSAPADVSAPSLNEPKHVFAEP